MNQLSVKKKYIRLCKCADFKKKTLDQSDQESFCFTEMDNAPFCENPI